MRKIPSILRLSAAAVAALVLAACQSHPVHNTQNASGVATTLATVPVLRQDAFNSVYEITASADGTSVFVASINGFDKQNAGFIQKLDARTLQSLQTIQVPRRSFALGLNNATGMLYVGNTMEGSLSIVDTNSGIVKGTIQLAPAEKDDKGNEYFAHTRKVIVDEARNRIFVTSPGTDGMVWIVDGATHQVLHTIKTGEPWTAGAAFDSTSNRLYVSGGGVHEIFAIDPDNGTIVQRISTGDTIDSKDSKHFFINLAIDAKGQRLFATDANSNSIYVVDVQNGKVLHQVATEGLGLLDVVYSIARNELVATHRGVSRQQPQGTGTVTVFDGNSFAVKQRHDLPVHPNSLALSPNGQTLYVTVKTPHGDKHPAARKDSKDSVVRIDLQ